MEMRISSGERRAVGKAADRADSFFTEPAENSPKTAAERFCMERTFISSNARASGFAARLERMLKSPEFSELLLKVERVARKVAREREKAPSTKLSDEDMHLLLNFRVNFNAVLKDSSLRKVLVKCMDDADYSKLKSMAVKMHKDTEVKAGFDSVTFLVRPEEKFRLTLGAMLDLAL